jgi:hypothetical protein
VDSVGIVLRDSRITSGIFVRGSTVFFGAKDQVLRTTTTGGTPLVAATTITGFGTGIMAADINNLYSVGSTGANVRHTYVQVIPFSGAAPYQIDVGRRLPSEVNCYDVSNNIESDGTYLYLPCDADTYWLARITITDGTKTALVIPATVSSMALAGNDLIFTSAGAIKGVAKDFSTSPVSRVTPVGSQNILYARLMAVVDGTIFWFEYKSGSANSGSIRSAPLGGGSPTIRTTGLPETTHNLKANSGYLYFADDTTIRRMSLSTYVMTTVVSATTGGDYIIDGNVIYWTKAGEIRKMRLPP